MALLEDLTPGVLVKGLLPGGNVTVISVKRHGSTSVELVYKDANGHLGNELLYSDGVENLEIAAAGLPLSSDADGSLFRLTSEAYRIRLAYLFDPLIAVHTSLIEPLPHQITAVYDTMLAKQPLRYLLADDPGAGKTIMTGLLIKELMIRGDLHRCLIVSPGNLVEQWQDELNRRFHIVFDILTNDRLEVSASGNAFTEMPLCIARLDKLSRDEYTQEKLRQTEWDLIVVDEAHKMSATFFGGEVRYTKRYQLGEVLGKITRHLLLLTATPHSGKEEDFQLFLRLLDADRFEGRFRDGVHKVDVSDLMRHLAKPQRYTFEGTPLFPERLAYTVNYHLSGSEETLYEEVTDYVRQEFNRAEALESSGSKGTVGFALTTLQRRLASSPEAIYQSLKRRRERLERRLHEAEQARQHADAPIELLAGLPSLSEDELDDLDDAPGAELEEAEERIVDQASAARSIAELEVEIALLERLEALALQVRRSGSDRKWEGLASLLQNNAEMFDVQGHRRKLVVFTEHRDTLNYLAERIRTMLGRAEAVVTIHGGMGREERARAQESFTQDKQVQVLVATDAAGEGINLKRAHLMVNYDLPWNPNRLEQRFGRIHRIGQQEVCHLWNLMAKDTREGDVYVRLLEKLEAEREALGGKVYDVLGQLFEQKALRELLMEAIRYGNDPEVKARLHRVVDSAVDRTRLEALLEQRMLVHHAMDTSRLRALKEEMERAHARRLQPHFIQAFFLDALPRLGGQIHRREAGRFEITHVPAAVRERDRHSGQGVPVLQRYERVCFDKEKVDQTPRAELICPGSPLLAATIDLLLQRYGEVLKRGAVLVDEADPGTTPRLLFSLEHAVQDGRRTRSGELLTVSRHLQFVEVGPDGTYRHQGAAPYLDYRPLTATEQALVASELDTAWLRQDWDNAVLHYAITQVVPDHVEEVKRQRLAQIDKVERQV